MRHTFIKADGQVTRCDRIVQGPTLKPGYWWHRTDTGWVEVPEPPTMDVNDCRLFGYTESEFLAKQYRA